MAAIAPYAWLLALFLAPFVIVLKLSLSDVALSVPPFAPQLDWSRGLAGLTEFLGALDFERPAPSAGNRVPGEVSDVGYTGDWTTYGVATAFGRLQVARANASRTPERPIAAGDKVWVSFDADAGVVLTR